VNLERGLFVCNTKVFFRPDIDNRHRAQVFDDEVMKQEAMSNEY